MGERRRHAGLKGALVGRYLLGRVVGKGVSSEVRLATDTANNELVALKIMQKEWIWKNDMGSLVRREIDIMRELDHPSVVKLIEVFNSETHVFMAMEAVDGRELYEELMRQGRVDETRARDLFQQLMMAVEYLHSIGVAHRDIKLENVLLSDDGQRIKVTDFGLAARLDEWEGGTKQKRRAWGGPKRKQRRQRTACGTPAYAAPEVIDSSDEQRYDARGVDTWCAGVCLYTMVTGNLPFQGSNVDDTLDAVRTKEIEFPKQLSPLLTDLLRGMLCKEPLKRLTVAAVLSHPWTARTTDLASLQPGEIEDQEHLAEAARLAIREARLAASEAERAAAAAQAAETNAAKALAAVKLAVAAPGGSAAARPTLKRSASVGSHRRATSVDSHREGVVTAEPRQDHEWSSGAHERTYSADDSMYGGGENTGPPQTERSPPPPPVIENGEIGGGGGGARGPGAFVATAASAWRGLVTRRPKLGRSESASRGDGGSSAENGGRAETADRDDGPLVSKTPQRAISPGDEDGSPLASDDAGKRLRRERATIERSLSSAFAATSSFDSAAPPPIEHSMSFELTVSPANVPAARVGSGNGGKARVSNSPHLGVPGEADADAATSKLPPSTEADEQPDVHDSPDPVDKTPETAKVEGGGMPCPSLATTPTMSMSPPSKQVKPSNSGGYSASSPRVKEGGPLASLETVPVVGPLPGQQDRPSASHRPEYAPSSEPSLVTSAPSPTNQPAGSPVAEQPGNTSVGALDSAVSAGTEGEEAVSRASEPNNEVAADEATEEKDGVGGAVGVEVGRQLTGDIAQDAAEAEENMDVGVNGAPVKQLGAACPLEAPPTTASPPTADKAAEKEKEKEDGLPLGRAKGVEKKPPAEVEGATAAASATATATAAEKSVDDTADGDAEARSHVTAAVAPLGAVAAGHGSEAMVDGVAASVDMEFSAKARPLPPLRPKHLAEPSLTNTTTRMSRPDDVAVTAAVQETKAGLPSPVAKEGPQEASVPRSPTSTANEVPEPATATATTDEPKAGPSSTIGGPLAAAVAGDSLPATDIRALPAAAVVVAAAVVSPRASGVGEEEVFGTNPREEPREPSAGVPAEAAEKVEMASGKVDRAVASNSAEAATSELSDEDEPFAALAAASDEARVESSRGAGGVSPVTAGGAGEREQPASTTGTAVDKTASAPVPGGAVITPTSLGNKVTGTHAENSVSTGTAAVDESSVEAPGTRQPPPSPPSPPSYYQLFSRSSEAEGDGGAEIANGGEVQEGDAEGGGQKVEENREEAPKGQATETEAPADGVPAASVALGGVVAALDGVSSVPAIATRSAQRPAEHGLEQEQEEEEEEEEEQSGRQAGERSARGTSRSPARGAVVWESINPFVNNAANTAELSSRPSASRAAAVAKKREPKVYHQPSTFKEMMTGIQETPGSEEVRVGGASGPPPTNVNVCEDDDAESRYRGDDDQEEEEEEDDGGEGVSGPAATNIRKLAEAEDIWGSGPGDDVAQEASARRKVSGRYLRVNGQFRPRSLQPHQGRGRPGERGKDPPASKERQRELTPAGDALGRPSAVFEAPVDGKPGAGPPEKHAAIKPRKGGGKGIGRKISRMFGRKPEVK